MPVGTLPHLLKGIRAVHVDAAFGLRYWFLWILSDLERNQIINIIYVLAFGPQLRKGKQGTRANMDEFLTESVIEKRKWLRQIIEKMKLKIKIFKFYSCGN